MHPCGSTKEGTKVVGAFKSLSIDHAIWKCHQSEGSPETSEARAPEVWKTREEFRNFGVPEFWDRRKEGSKELQNLEVSEFQRTSKG